MVVVVVGGRVSEGKMVGGRRRKNDTGVIFLSFHLPAPFSIHSLFSFFLPSFYACAAYTTHTGVCFSPSLPLRPLPTAVRAVKHAPCTNVLTIFSLSLVLFSRPQAEVQTSSALHQCLMIYRDEVMVCCLAVVTKF